MAMGCSYGPMSDRSGTHPRRMPGEVAEANAGAGAEMKAAKKWCWYCKHRGSRFRIGNSGHVHCEHPDLTHPGMSPYDTLHTAYESCPSFDAGTPKQEQEKGLGR